MNIVPLQNIFASRYLYLPSVGFCLLVAFAYDEGVKRINSQRAVLLKIILAGIITGYCFLIWQHNARWNNEIALRAEFIRHYPRSSIAHKGLGAALYRNYFGKCEDWSESGLVEKSSDCGWGSRD